MLKSSPHAELHAVRGWQWASSLLDVDYVCKKKEEKKKEVEVEPLDFFGVLLCTSLWMRIVPRTNKPLDPETITQCKIILNNISWSFGFSSQLSRQKRESVTVSLFKSSSIYTHTVCRLMQPVPYKKMLLTLKIYNV